MAPHNTVMGSNTYYLESKEQTLKFGKIGRQVDRQIGCGREDSLLALDHESQSLIPVINV